METVATSEQMRFRIVYVRILYTVQGFHAMQ
jgi:hypothetical protein